MKLKFPPRETLEIQDRNGEPLIRIRRMPGWGLMIEAYQHVHYLEAPEVSFPEGGARIGNLTVSDHKAKE